MTLEEAISWCSDNEVDICFYINKNHEKKIRIDLGSYSLVEACNTVVEAVEKAKIEIEELTVRNRYV